MTRVLVIVAILAAFVVGVVVGWPLREKKKIAMEQFMHNVHCVRSTANISMDILESLQSGALDKAQRRAAQTISGYYAVYSNFDDAPDKTEFLQRIEVLRDKSAPLKTAIEEDTLPKKSP